MKHRAIFGACLALLATTATANPTNLPKGTRLAGGTPPAEVLQGDIDGDELFDTVTLVEVTGGLPKSLRVMWTVNRDDQSTKDSPKSTRSLKPKDLALLIDLTSKGRFLVPLQVAREIDPWSSKSYQGLLRLRHGSQPPKDAKGISIEIPGPGGEEYLHWNGSKFIESYQGNYD